MINDQGCCVRVPSNSLHAEVPKRTIGNFAAQSRRNARAYLQPALIVVRLQLRRIGEGGARIGARGRGVTYGESKCSL